METAKGYQLLLLRPMDKLLLLGAASAIVTVDGRCGEYDVLPLRALCAALALDVPVPSLDVAAAAGQARQSVWLQLLG